MLFHLAAGLLFVLHLAFVVFVMLGGLLVFEWRWFALLHLPAVLWGFMIEYRSGECPLTPWENRMRRLAGGAAYTGGFIEHYFLTSAYRRWNAKRIQLVIAMSVAVVNLVIYVGLIWATFRH